MLFRSDLFGGPGFGHGGWKHGETSEAQKGQQETDSSSETKPLIAISGGSLTIVNTAARDADGVDSNGDILISGGTVRVSIVDGGTNNALDYGSENGGVCKITGGSVIACGGSGMTEEISASSSQCSVFFLLNESVPAGTAVCLKDMEGNILNPVFALVVSRYCGDNTEGVDIAYLVDVDGTIQTAAPFRL